MYYKYLGNSATSGFSRWALIGKIFGRRTWNIFSGTFLAQINDVSRLILMFASNVPHPVGLDFAAIFAVGTLETRPKTAFVFEMAREIPLTTEVPRATVVRAKESQSIFRGVRYNLCKIKKKTIAIKKETIGNTGNVKFLVKHADKQGFQGRKAKCFSPSRDFPDKSRLANVFSSKPVHWKDYNEIHKKEKHRITRKG